MKQTQKVTIWLTYAEICSRVSSYDIVMTWEQQKLAFKAGVSALPPNREMKPENAP